MNAHDTEANQRWLLRRATEIRARIAYTRDRTKDSALVMEMLRRDPDLETKWHQGTAPRGTDTWYLEVIFAGVQIWVGGWPALQAQMLSRQIQGERADQQGPLTPAPFAYADWLRDQGKAAA